MARTLTLARFPPKSSSSPIPLSIRAFAHRFFSAYGPKPQLIELDLDSSSSSSCDASGEIEVLALRKLEDVIHGIIVRRAAPDWLPFRPGSSYWVPPKPRAAGNLVHLVDKLANPLTEEETLSFSSVRGWPDSSFFLQGIAPPESVPMEAAEVHMHVQYHADKTSESEDDE